MSTQPVLVAMNLLPAIRNCPWCGEKAGGGGRLLSATPVIDDNGRLAYDLTCAQHGALTRRPCRPHQIEGMAALVAHPFFALFDDMGAAKSKQVIDAFCYLYAAGRIDAVVILAPADVRTGVWYQPPRGALVGELGRHLWPSVAAFVSEYHQRTRTWTHGSNTGLVPLDIFVTNYEFLRQRERLMALLAMLKGKRAAVYADESSMIANTKAQQSKASLELRRKCVRAAILNGTPVEKNPLDVFGQFAFLDPTPLPKTEGHARNAGKREWNLGAGFGCRVLGAKSFYEFRLRHAIIDNRAGFPKIIGWQNLEQLQARIRPHALRRLAKDCWGDLPGALDPVSLVVRLTPETWKVYRAMREQMLVWLDANTSASAAQAGVRAMRLAQITGGFVGGVETTDEPEAALDDDQEPSAWPAPADEYVPGYQEETGLEHLTARDLSGRSAKPALAPRLLEGSALEFEPTATGEVREVGREKLEALLSWARRCWEEEPGAKLIAWHRFRPEVVRAVAECGAAFPDATVIPLWGSQSRAERSEAVRLLDPDACSEGPGLVLGISGTGGRGLNCTASHHMLFISNGSSWGRRAQTMKRVDRPGQKFPVWYGDVLAEGPSGQKTIDHTVVAALRAGEDLATWTVKAWQKVMREEIALEKENG